MTKTGPAIPYVRFPNLKIQRQGSTWRVRHEDKNWPLILYARDVYYGTGRMLTALTLDRHDEGMASPIRILTSSVDLLTATHRKNFAKEASERLDRASGGEGQDHRHLVPITSMLDALLESVTEARNEIEIKPLSEVPYVEHSAPIYPVWPIVPQMRPGMLVAASGSGKSTLAGMIGLSVVSEHSFLPRIETREPGPVIYVGQEEDADTMRRRMEMIIRGHQIKNPGLGHYYFVRLRSGSLIDAAENIAEKVASVEAKLVIIDSAQATWGSEGDQVRDYATRWFNAVDSLGCATLIIEHPNLAQTKKNIGDGWSAGTVVKRDRSGHVWGVKSTELPVRDGQPFRYHVTLTDAKRNYVARQPNIDYEIQIDGFNWMRFDEAGGLTADAIVDSSRTWDAVASIMREPDELHEEVGWTVSELVERLGVHDDKRLRAELGLEVWRSAKWDEGVEVRPVQVGGSGKKGDPAQYRLEQRIRPVQLSVAPGDDGAIS